MKKSLKALCSAILVLAMVVTSFAMGTPKTALAEDQLIATNSMDGQLVVLHTNDMHGYYDETEENLGIDAVAAAKDYYEGLGADVLLLDAGDFSQGTTLVSYYDGLNAVEFMNAADYDAVSLGNHEFDYGFDELLAMADLAEFQILDANIISKDTGKPYFGGNYIFELEDYKVGVFGLDTPETQTKASPKNVELVDFLDGDDLMECAKAQVAELEAAGCDFIICLAHLGVDDESIGRRSIDVMEQVDGIDLFVDGHSHTEIPGGQEAGDGLIVSTGNYLNNLGVVVYNGTELNASLVSAADYNDDWKSVTYTVVAGDYLKKISGLFFGAENLWKPIYEANKDSIENPNLIRIGQKLTIPVSASAAKVEALIQADVDEVAAAYEKLFASTLYKLDGSRAPGVRTQETNLGNFAADSYMYNAKQYVAEYGLDVTIDGAIQNGGGIRATIEAGEISMNTLKTVFPYNNTISIVTLTGAELLEALEASCFSCPDAVGGFPQTAGIVFTIDTTVAYEQGEQYPDSTYYAPAKPGSRVTIKTVGGKDFSLTDTYSIAVNNFMAAGGDTYYVFTNASFNLNTEIIDSDGLINYVNSMNGIIGEEYKDARGDITIIK